MRRLRQLTPALAAALAIGVAGCGEDAETGTLLSQSRADTLLGLLEDAEQQFDDGECDELDQTLSRLQQEVSGVSNEVDEQLRAALEEEASELAQYSVDCEQAEEPAPPPVTVPEETIPEETIPEETIPEETVPEETVPEEPPPEKPPPEENGEDGANGDDNSSGPGSGGSSGSGSSGGGVVPPGQEGGTTPPPSAGEESGSVGPVADSGGGA